MFEDTKRFHRVPVGFGPAPTPRQDASGKPYPTWGQAETNTVGVTFVSDREYLNSILPQGYEVSPAATPTILFEVMELRKLPWLNGRGYNTFGVYINDVVCNRVSPPQGGSYMAVLFESFTDPITTGREELGFCKLWAELPDGQTDADGKRVHTASWHGSEFMRLELSNLVKKEPSESPAIKPRAEGHPQQKGTLHHRYVPAVGLPGQHDASYATYMPPGGSPPKVLHYETVSSSFADSVKFDIVEGTWEEFPTLWNVIEGLRKVPKKEILEVSVHTFQGASDCSPNKRIEW